MIGSHIWGLNTNTSDKDFFVIVQQDTTSILRGEGILPSKFVHDENKNIDIHFHELEKVINQIIKGNFNFSIGVLSPIYFQYNFIAAFQLRRIMKKNLSKRVFPSLFGLITHNYKKYILNNHKKLRKKERQIKRYVYICKYYLRHGEFPFFKVNPDEIGNLEEEINQLPQFLRTSHLPDEVNEDETREELLRFRMANLSSL